jgi:hypothetical protein
LGGNGLGGCCFGAVQCIGCHGWDSFWTIDQA